MAEKINGRVAYADLLRSFATIAVIVLHLAGSQMANVPVGSGDWQVLNLYDGLTRWCVPVFVMLSGMFMLDPKRSLPLSKLFFHNILRILVCFLFWNWLYILIGSGNISVHGVLWAFREALVGQYHYHLWFLYIIIAFYLVTPILRAFVRGASRGDLRYFLLLAFLFSSLLPTLFRLWPNATAGLQIWYKRLAVQVITGYVGFYVGGYYLKEYTISRVAEAVVYVLGLCGAIVTVWGTAVLSRRAGTLVDVLYEYASPNVVCFSVAVVVLFRYVLGVSEERSRRQRLSGVARISFGIYLVHDFFIMLLNNFHITVLSFTPVAAVPALAAAVFLLSLAVAWLISKVPFVGRYLT